MSDSPNGKTYLLTNATRVPTLDELAAMRKEAAEKSTLSTGQK